MAVGVLMPKEGITVESCVMGEWKKQVGDQVNVGDILFSYETDKAEFECESTAAGTLIEVFYQEGDEVPCLVNVCAIGNPGEDTSALKNAAPASEAPAAPAAAVEAPKAAAAAAPAGPCAQAVIMPKEGITVESCIMGEWKKNVGDTVAVGDVLFSYETDKAEFECESTAAGTLLARFYEEGDEVPCLENVCAIGNAGDAFEHLRPGSEVPAPTAAPAAEAAAPAAAAVAAPAARLAISPRAMAKAVANNVNPDLATGTGPKGR
ncbi:MAG: pyruvate dehydrogenase, partial [Clostridia bacterium]|nr:pyruvate dehydrogenase [Clostridia bacterium]